MVGFENRSGVYVEVHEHRKRRDPPFAGRHGLKYQHTLVWFLDSSAGVLRDGANRLTS